MYRFMTMLSLICVWGHLASCGSIPHEPVGPAPYDDTQPLDFTCAIDHWEKRDHDQTWAVLNKEKVPYGAHVVFEVTLGNGHGTITEIYRVAPYQDIHIDGKGEEVVALAITSCQPFRPRKPEQGNLRQDGNDPLRFRG